MHNDVTHLVNGRLHSFMWISVKSDWNFLICAKTRSIVNLRGMYSIRSFSKSNSVN